MEDITFYPELRYRGFGVQIWNGWHAENEEPLLGCLLGAINPAIEAEGGVTHAMIVEANRRRSEDEQAWKRVMDRYSAATKKVVQRVLDDGWELFERDVYFRYIHVDDLEKIEGPVPEGPF